MAVPAVPGTAYGAAGEAGNAVYTAEHRHVWKYEQQGTDLVTAVCQENGESCDVGRINLTLRVEKDSENQNSVVVLADGLPLSENDSRNISYRVRYYNQKGSSIGTQPPKKNGEYKVRVIFGSSGTLSSRPYVEADYIIQHTHSWKYEKPQGSSVMTAVCQGKEGSCEAGKIALTLRVEKGSGSQRRAVVLANGTELPGYNDWNIQYQIRYFDQNGSDMGTQSPTENGKYKVRAIFEDSSLPSDKSYLEADYTIQHTHSWRYERPWGGENAVTAVCQGEEGSCEAGKITLTLRVEKDSKNQKKVLVLADGKELPADNTWNIPYRIRYFNKNGGSIGTAPPKKNGEYKVRAVFGDNWQSSSAPYVEGDYTIQHTHEWKYEKTWEESSVVTAVCQGTEGSCDAGRIPLTLRVEKDADNQNRAVVLADELELPRNNSWGIQYKIMYLNQYGTSMGTQPPTENGEYKVRAVFGSSGQSSGAPYLEADYTVRNQPTWEQKDSRSGITVSMKSHYDRKSKVPVPQLNMALEDGAGVTYYYNTKAQNTGGVQWSAQKGKNLKAGTYYMYAVIGETAHYRSYITPVCKFTVHADHKWNLPKDLSAKSETEKTISCRYCGKTQTVTLPAKTVSIAMGKSKLIKSKGCTFGKVKKKYFSLSSSGRMTARADSKYYRSMKTSVPVTVKAYGKTYHMKVKLVIPAPEVKVTRRKAVGRNESGFRFEFRYYVPNADKMQVWMDEVNRFEEPGKMKKYFKKYFSNPRPVSPPYINLSNRNLEKAQTVTFHIRACYGQNKSRAVRKNYRYN